MNDSVNISLPSKPEYVSVARLTASVIASQMGFDIEAIEDIKLAVGEACNNAVMHSGTDSTYEMKLKNLQSNLVIEVIDFGKGFELKDYQVPDLDALQENGLGLFIIQSLMDHVEVNVNTGKGTTIVMSKAVE